MPGFVQSLFKQPFTSVSTIVVTHNLARRDVTVRCMIEAQVTNERMLSWVQTPGNEDNELTVTLDSAQTGVIQLVNGDTLPVLDVRSIPCATETLQGVAEIATQAETDAGTDDVRYVTPLRLATWWADRAEINGDQRLRRTKSGEDWAVAVRPASADDGVSGAPLAVFYLDDTIEEGVGYENPIRVPSTTTKITIKFVSRARSAPAGARSVGVKVYVKGYPDNAPSAASGAGWSAGVQLSDIAIPASVDWQYDSDVKTLASIGVVAGELTRFEWTRVAPLAGTDLAGDWAVIEGGGIMVSFS